jgi:diguanylate cyclase (GGDEF)-like protein
MFHLEYTPYIWTFVISLIITTVLGIYAYRHRHLHTASTFALLMFALSVWTFCYVMELSTVTLEGKIFWASAKYFGSTLGPIVWFVLALHLTKNSHWLTPQLQMFFWAFGIITCFVVFTNEFHHWYWTDIYLVEGLPETKAKHGFYFWVYAAMIHLISLTSVVLFFRYYRTTPDFYRRQALLIALGGFVPASGRIVEDFFKIDLFPNVDNVILLFLLSGIFFALAIFRYGAFHIVHIAHSLVIQNISAGIIVLDMSEHVVELNPYAKALMHSASSPTIGKPLGEVLAKWPKLEIKPGAEQEVAVPSSGGEQWFQLQCSQIKSENGEDAGYAVVLFDITARKHAEQQLVALARTDPLTGIINRRFFYELAETEFARARRYQRPLSILMIDIDHFKNINDTYGHLVGDEVIKFLSVECKRQLRTTDIFARFGGEEFICLLHEENPQDACQTAERIRRAIAASRFAVAEQAIEITISIGIASLCSGETTLSELINQADQALYLSKSNGRNRVSLWVENRPEGG